MPKDDEVKLKASTEGVEIAIGGDAGRQLGTSLADAISPFTETLGALGDEVRRFRIHREARATATLIRANEIREKRGIEDNPVSPKLLAPWLEGASLEGDDKENISELWATLLAECPSDFSSQHAVLIDTLGRMGKTEAEALEQFVPDLQHSLNPMMPWSGEHNELYLEMIEGHFGKIVEYFNSEKSDRQHFGDYVFESFNASEKELWSPCARAVSLSARSIDEAGNMSFLIQNSKYGNKYRDSLLVLEHNGLLKQEKVCFDIEDEGISGYLMIYELTSLGIRLLTLLYPLKDRIVLVTHDESQFDPSA